VDHVRARAGRRAAGGQPVLLGSLFRSVAHALHATGRFRGGVDLIEAAADVLQPHLSSRADDALLSVYGSLFLTGAVAASRADDRRTTAFLTEAQDGATRLGRDANAMWTAFGPTNVAIHRLAGSKYQTASTARHNWPNPDGR